MSRRRLPFSLTAAAALTFGAGLSATAVLFVAVGQLEYDKVSLGFDQRASVRVAAIRKGLGEAVDVLTVTNHLFAAVGPVTRSQFHAFTEPLLERYPFIQAFNYHRIVPHAARAAHEARLAAIVPGTVFTELAAGARRPAPARASYHVVDYLEPMQGNEAAFGLDVGPNAALRAALDSAVASGQVASTGLLTLAQDTMPMRGFQVVMPVYRAGMPLAAASERRAALEGDTAAIIRAPALVHTILSGAGLLSDPSVGLAVYAGERADPATLVYSTGPQAQAPQRSTEGLNARMARWFALDYRNRYDKTFDAAGRRWRIQVGAAPRSFLGDHLGSLTTLVGGVLVSLLMAAIVQTLLRRSRRVQALVKERTADLQRSEQRFRQLVAMSSDWYWEQDRELRFTVITGGLVDKSGISVERLIGKTRWDSVPGMADSDWGRAHIARLQAHQNFADFEYATSAHDGSERWISVNGEALFDDSGAFLGYRGTGSDITARKHSEQRIQHIAHHDALTGLPNRVLLQDRLRQAVAYSQRSGQSVWVMLIDLDRFKFVNDSMGHKAGDLLLQTVAARVQACLRQTDTVARLSGDEFVAIVGERSDETLSPEVVRRVMQAVAQPVPLDGKQFFVTCSIGVAVYPSDGAPSRNLIEHADIAMYRAKKLGRNTFQFYTPAMNEEARERLRIEGALRSALEREQFVLHYQPQLDLASGRIVGMEALLRWQHPELGMVAPNRFIGLAEETGLIVPIGAWVMRSACAQARAWQDAGLGSLRIAVNLSARQFAEPGLLGTIAAVLDETGLAASCLDIELTESLFMNDVTQAVELMHGMKALGVKLSIDDFGTGFSSLSYLSSFPIDVLKIDRSFIDDITRGAAGAPIVASIIALAHNLKLSVIAEGVETESQLDYLRAHGCDQMQGYLFSRPLAADAFELLLRQRKSLPVFGLLEESTLG